MTRLLLAMLRARRGIALAVTAIAAVAVAAAAAGPIYLAAADAAARQTELAGAPPGERVIGRSWSLDHGALHVGERISDRRDAPRLSGFDTVTGVQVSGDLVDGGKATARRPVAAWMVQRSGVCDQVTLVAGRCVSGGWEVMIARKGARDLGVGVGDTITFEPDKSEEFGNPWSRDDGNDGGGVIRLSIVGLYQPKDAGSAYWADREYVAGGDGLDRQVLFATSETVAWTPYRGAREIIDLVPRAEAFDDLPRLRAITANVAEDAQFDENSVTGELPALLDRMEASGRALTEAVALAVVPLVLLCWLVLYLAVVDSAFRRRAEAGLSGLRGMPAGTRWWLGAGEYLVPVLLGAPVGLLLGYLAVAGVARWMLPGEPAVTVTPLALLFALAAVLGAVGVGVAAQWRATAVPIVDLLRRVPGVRHTGRLRPAELIAVALATAATYQVVSGGQRSGGLALLTPMLLALAIGLVAARLAAPIAVRLSRRSLRRGAVGRSLAGILLARQPGHARLLSMFVVLFGLLGFAVTAADVAQRARHTRVTAELGAPRVLDVDAQTSRNLLAAVRAADPTGRYAMATTQLPGDGPPVLAVDSTRLAQVAHWSQLYGPPAARAAALLRPAEPRPIRFSGTGLDLRAEVTGRQPEGVRLQLRVQPDKTAQPAVEYSLTLRRGRVTYHVDTPACRSGCRLVGLPLSSLGRPSYDLTLTLRWLRLSATVPAPGSVPGQGPGSKPESAAGSKPGSKPDLDSGSDSGSKPDSAAGSTPDSGSGADSPGSGSGTRPGSGPDSPGSGSTTGSTTGSGGGAEVVGPAGFGDPSRWNWTRTAGGTAALKVTHDADGVRLAYSGNAGPSGSLVPVATPLPVPILSTPGRPPGIAVSGTATTWRRVGELNLVVGAGAAGALIDLEYANLAEFLPGGMGRRPQVWLSADAPDGVLERLREQGISMTADRKLTTERDREDNRGPALAVRFYLVVAAAAVALGLGGVAVVASTQRSALAAQLRALRVQGVPPGITWRAGFGGHAALSLLAAAVGTATAGLAWRVGRGTLPLFVDGAGGAASAYAPAWPHPLPVALALLAALLALTAAGAVATLGLRRAVERTVDRGNR